MNKKPLAITRENVDKAFKALKDNKDLFESIGASEIVSETEKRLKEISYALKMRDEYGYTFFNETLSNAPMRFQEGDDLPLIVAIENIVSFSQQNVSIVRMGPSFRRMIGWSVDERQPEDGELMVIVSFPTGRYIIDDECPRELFQEMWEEIKSYGCKYCDDRNKSAYFSIENGAAIVRDFYPIIKKYWKIFEDGDDQRRKAKLLAEIAKIEERERANGTNTA